MDIWCAAREGDLDALEANLAAGANVAARDALGKLPTMCAIEGQHAAVLQRLLAAGADPNAASQIAPWRQTRVMYSNHPLIHVAASVGEVDVVRVLLKAGVDPGQHDAQSTIGPKPSRGHYTTTPLLEAASRGHTAVVRLLVEAGADINEGGGPCDEFTGITPVLVALQHHETLKALLALGADPERARADGCLPMCEAAADPISLQLLLEAGADASRAPSGRYADGWSPIFIAVLCGQKDSIKLLLAHGADRAATTTHERGISYEGSIISVPAGTSVAALALRIGRPDLAALLVTN